MKKESMKLIACPDCAKVTMTSVVLPRRATAQMCPRCKGTWITKYEMDVFKGGDSALPVVDDVRSLEKEIVVRCPKCRAHSLMRAPALNSKTLLLQCTSCAGFWARPGGLNQIKIKDDTGPLSAKARKRRSGIYGSVQTLDHHDIVSFNSLSINFFTYPIVIALCWYFANQPGLEFLYMLMHELGHAVAAWLTGRAATPTPLGITTWGEESGPMTRTYFALTLLVIVLGYSGLRQKRLYSLFVGFTLIGLLNYFCFKFGADKRLMITIFGGHAGELLLSAFFMLSFYYRFPKVFFWDVLRFPVLAYSTLVFLRGYTYWVKMPENMHNFPIQEKVGSVAGELHSDMYRIVHEFGMSPVDITHIMIRMGHACTLVLVTAYCYFVFSRIDVSRIPLLNKLHLSRRS